MNNTETVSSRQSYLAGTLANRQRSARIAAGLLVLHGLIEVSGLLMIKSLPHSLESFGNLGQSQIEVNAISIVSFGVIWGLSRLVAAWGTWSLKKWAIALGIVISLATLITALTIIPAGVADSVLAVPALICLLHAWFGNEEITPYRPTGETG